MHRHLIKKESTGIVDHLCYIDHTDHPSLERRVTGMGGWRLTLAGMSVALLCRSPGQIIVQISATLAVHTCCVMLAVTLRTHLQRDRERLMKRCLIKGQLKSLRLWSIQDWRHMSKLSQQSHTNNENLLYVRMHKGESWKERKEQISKLALFVSQIAFLWVGGVSNQHTGSFQRLLWHFVADFVATKADILKDTSGDYPAKFVVAKSDILDETSGAFPAVFVATKPGIVRQNFS